MTTAQLSAALVAKGTVTVVLTKPHDPAAFYRTRTGLYVFRGFRDHIVRQAKPTQSVSPVTLRRFVLERDASDEEIEDELGPNHVFTETDVCWIVAEMIGKQEGGTLGSLDNTGKANLLCTTNLFYTPSWVVHVRWNAFASEWDVRIWGRGVGDNGSGDSAFSRT